MGLDANMGGGFDLKVSSPLIRVEIAREGAFDISGACDMALDQVAVVGVHHAHERSELIGGARVQGRAQCRGSRRQLR
jgi:hypothetical protein